MLFNPDICTPYEWKKTIIVADDHIIVRRGVTILLDRMNVTGDVLETETFKETLEACTNERPELIILDINLQATDFPKTPCEQHRRTDFCF